MRFSVLKKSLNSLFNCFYQTQSKLPFQELLPKISPDLNSISFHWFLSGKNFEIVLMFFQTHIYSFELTSSCPSKNYILKSFPDLNSISFHGFLSGKKYGDCFNVDSNSHQTARPNITSYYHFQISTPFLFIIFMLEKNGKIVSLLETFFQGSKSSPLKWSPKNLFSIFSKF